jgi:hypothetical protein
MAISRITTESILDGEITDGKIAGVAASKLTGALPAISGASLTNLPSEITKSSSDPTVSTNPSGGVGTVYLNTTSGEMWSCTDATAGANVWTTVVPPTYMSATGGTITTDGDYKVHTFTASGTFTPTVGNAASVGTTVAALVVAGAGGGSSDLAGGGGAGGLIYNASFSVTDTGLTVTVGAGGATSAGTTRETNTMGSNGANSVFSSLTAIGGGRGGAFWSDNATYTTGAVGGSGGGAGAGNSNPGIGGAGTASQGYAGGTSTNAPHHAAGGGGGSGAVGGNASTSTSGNGGVGLSNSITGSAVYYAGGGAGGAYTGNAGSGGNGGGGQGWDSGAGATAGTANTGGGGGGGGYTTVTAEPTIGAAGGSGIVIIRYQFQA